MKDALQHKIDLKTKPHGALGQLEDIALQIGLIQQTLSPSIDHPCMLVFAADHGITDEGVSLYPRDVTWQMVYNFVGGGAAINVFCRQNGIDIQVVDAGVDHDFPADCPIIHAKIAKGSRNMMLQPAMTHDECLLAMEKGAELIRERAALGCNTIGFGEMGIGNTSPSALLMHRLMHVPIEVCTGAGTGFGPEGVRHKTEVLRRVSERYDPQTPLDTLATFGGLEIAMMVGAIREAKRQGMVILVDGFIATASVLMAMEFEPEVRNNCVFCHVSDEQGHAMMLDYLKAEPVLRLRMRVGEGTGAAVALPVIRSAVHFLNEMASFEEAGVSNKD